MAEARYKIHFSYLKANGSEWTPCGVCVSDASASFIAVRNWDGVTCQNCLRHKVKAPSVLKCKHDYPVKYKRGMNIICGNCGAVTSQEKETAPR